MLSFDRNAAGRVRGGTDVDVNVRVGIGFVCLWKRECAGRVFGQMDD